MFKKRRLNNYRLLICLLFVVILGMLYFGIRFKGFRPENCVRWADEGPGLYFDRYGIAYTEPVVFPARDQGLTLEIALQPEIPTYGGFHFILTAHDGNDARQLFIGQWFSELIVMNGDDYENRRGEGRISMAIGRKSHETRLVSIVSGPSGTRLYLNGELKKENSALHLKWPENPTGARLVVGNSVYGHNFWRGEVSGLAVFAQDLSEPQVAAHYRQWRSHGDFAFAREQAPNLLYLLDEGAGELAHDRSGNAYHLAVPAYMKILKKEILVRPWRSERLTRRFVEDVLINFFGFWPLSFLLAAILHRSRRFMKSYWLVTVLLCTLFSLSIEIVQAWIPSRSSSLLDLILNSMGAAAGATLYLYMRQRTVFGRWLMR